MTLIQTFLIVALAAVVIVSLTLYIYKNLPAKLVKCSPFNRLGRDFNGHFYDANTFRIVEPTNILGVIDESSTECKIGTKKPYLTDPIPHSTFSTHSILKDITNFLPYADGNFPDNFEENEYDYLFAPSIFNRLGLSQLLHQLYTLTGITALNITPAFLTHLKPYLVINENNRLIKEIDNYDRFTINCTNPDKRVYLVMFLLKTMLEYYLNVTKYDPANGIPFSKHTMASVDVFLSPTLNIEIQIYKYYYDKNDVLKQIPCNKSLCKNDSFHIDMFTC